MKKYGNIIFISIMFFCNFDLSAQPYCKNDLVILGGAKDGYWPGFQAVQSVWLDDGIYGPSDLNQIDDGKGHLIIDCTSLKMITNKPTLLFGVTENSGEQRDFIKLRIGNYFTISRTFRVRFTIVEEFNEQIAQSEIFTIQGGSTGGTCNGRSVLEINIPAPLPGNTSGEYFKFRNSGIRHIKMELVEANGAQILDSDTENQVVLLKCDVKDSRNLPVITIPLLFKDRLFRYTSTYFSNTSSWFQEVQNEMKFVYDVLPVPEHDISNVINGGYAPLTPHTANNEDWIILTDEQKNQEFLLDLQNISRLSKFHLAGLKYLIMVDKDDMNPYPPPQHRGYLKPVGKCWPQQGIRNVVFIDWVRGAGSAISHELSHCFGLYLDGFEEYHPFLGEKTAYGYRVKTQENKNYSLKTPVYCYMSSNRPDDLSWVHKDDYRSVIDVLTEPSFTDPEIVSTAGTITLNNNTVALLPFYKFYSDIIDVDSLITTERYMIKLRNNSNQIIKQYGFNVNFQIPDSSFIEMPSASFNLNVPSHPGLKKIEICDSLGSTLAVRNVSDNSPKIDFLFPSTGQINGTDSVYISWNASDPDDDTLYAAIFYNVKIHGSEENIWLPVAIDVRGNHYNWRTMFIPNVNYRVKVFVSDGFNTAVDSSDGNFIVGTPTNLTVVPEGLYDASSNTSKMKDTIRLYLRNNFAPYSIIDSGKTVIDSLTLTGSLFFNTATSGTYYFVAKHRNSVETWSKTGGETYTIGSTFNYNFTSSALQAFGNNLKLADSSPVRYAIFSGDINQDKLIDLSDILLAYNASSSFTTGYNTTDVTGDNISDLSDIIITYNNSCNFVTAINP